MVSSTPAAVAKTGFCKTWWYCLLPLLCCLPLCCLPCLLCKNKRKYRAGHVTKPAKTQAVNQKNLVGKEVPEYKVEKVKEKKKKKKAIVRRVEEEQEDIEVEIERELAKKAVVEETVVVRKEIPVEEYEDRVRSGAAMAGQFQNVDYGNDIQMQQQQQMVTEKVRRKSFAGERR